MDATLRAIQDAVERHRAAIRAAPASVAALEHARLAKLLAAESGETARTLTRLAKRAPTAPCAKERADETYEQIARSANSVVEQVSAVERRDLFLAISEAMRAQRYLDESALLVLLDSMKIDLAPYFNAEKGALTLTLEPGRGTTTHLATLMRVVLRNSDEFKVHDLVNGTIFKCCIEMT